MGKRKERVKNKPAKSAKSKDRASKGKEETPKRGTRRARLAEFFQRGKKRIAYHPVRIWSGIQLAWRWLWSPEEVGKPITLDPRPTRSLVLLITGSAAILVLLVVALYELASAPPASTTPTVDGGDLPSGGASGATPTPFGSGGAIAFTLRRDGNADVYALNQAERLLVRLTHDPAEDRDPTWSPNGDYGDYVAFASNRSDNWDIYLLDLVSGVLIRLTRDPAFDGHPSWSPDGEWIAFESYRSGNLDIYVMNTTRDELRRITRNAAPDYAPAWAPDGSAIAFTSLRDGNKEIYIQTLDAPVEIVNLTNTSDVDEDNAAWSPDGTQLAYSSGLRGDSSVQVISFDWATLEADQSQTEIFAGGLSPCWAPDGRTLTYAYEQDGSSHVVAASVTAWAQFHEVFSIVGPLDDLEWTAWPLSARVASRAQADQPSEESPLYVEKVQPAPDAAPPLALIPLTNVEFGEFMFLSDGVDDSFSTLRERIYEEAGWDYLSMLGGAGLPTTHSPPPGHSRMSYHVCGRAIDLDQDAMEEAPPAIELVREDIGTETYWRVYIRAASQDGSVGEPLREPVWNILSRDDGGPAAIEGGSLRKRIPSGYYVDFTAIAADYGWERVPALWRWRYLWIDVRWWQFENRGGLSWWECMLEVYEPGEIEPAFGPIPGLED